MNRYKRRIPFINNEVTLKNITTLDNLIVIVSSLILSMMIADNLVQEQLVPVFVVLALFVFLFLYSPSRNNKGYNNLKSYAIMFRFYSEKPKLKDSYINNLTFKNVWNKGELKLKEVKPKKTNREIIDEHSYLSSGIAEVGYDSYKDKDNQHYKVVLIEYKEPIGVNPNTDEDNIEKTTRLLHSLIKPYKISFLRTSKPMLEDNLKYMKQLYDDEYAKTVKDEYNMKEELLRENMWYCNEYNKKKYLNTYYAINVSEVDVFISESQDFLNTTVLKGNELIEYLDIIQNEGVK